MKAAVLILICILSFSTLSFSQKDKEAIKLTKAVNKDAAKNAREANRAYKDRDYFTAIHEAVDALEGDLNKKNTKNITEILTESYALFETSSLKSIAEREAASSVYEGRNTVADRHSNVRHYTNLISTQDKLSTLDDATLASMSLRKSAFTDYRSHLENSNALFLEAANIYCTEEYAKGLEKLEAGTKQSAYQAYNHFDEVVIFLPDFEDAAELKLKAKETATYKILFVDFGTSFTPPPTSRGTNSISKYFEGSNGRTAKNSPYIPFTQFQIEGYNNELYLNVNNPEGIEAFCKAKDVDAVIFGSYDTPTYSYVDGKPYTRAIEKEVTVGEKKEMKDGKEVTVPIKQKVKASTTDYSRTNVSRVNGKFNFYDAYQQKYILKDFGMQGEHTMHQSWTIASGDERAFSEKEKNRFRKDAEPLPDRGDMQLSAVFELSKIVTNKSVETLKILFEGN
jgi:hypothetical protein